MMDNMPKIEEKKHEKSDLSGRYSIKMQKNLFSYS